MDGFSRQKNTNSLKNYFISVRQTTSDLINNLEFEDLVIQTENFVSPTKWHLAHTTWFFEEFILKKKSENYSIFNKNFNYVFNSYYNSIGDFNPKNKRGYLNRPLTKDILLYRTYVDEKMCELLEINKNDQDIEFLTKLGINHEQQHQELILMDIKNVFFNNPLKPSFCSINKLENEKKTTTTYNLNKIKSVNIGYQDDDFCFDNELPNFEISIEPFSLSSLIKNSEWKIFIKEGGYENPQYWLSDGWDFIKKNKITKPMYWVDNNNQFTLNGIKRIDDELPVSHISYYEADAFARFKKKRLPSEFEIELFLKENIKKGNFLESKIYQENNDNYIFGNLWVWTHSYYLPYKGYKPFYNQLSEYNSKFMCNQFVLRGGSFATPVNHIRSSYRNFYYPSDRWQFCGLRLVSSN